MKKYTLILLLMTTNSYGFKYEGNGHISLEYLNFPNEEKKESISKSYSALAFYQSELQTRYVDFFIEVAARSDHRQKERSYINFNSLYAKYINKFKGWSRFTVEVGFQTLNWSKMEAFHPADLMNSENYDADITTPIKKGEFLLNYAFSGKFGEFSFYYMPFFTEPNFATGKSRMGTASLGVSQALDKDYLKGDSSRMDQFAMRWNLPVNVFDMSVHLANHIDKKKPIYGTHKYSKIQGVYLPTEEEFSPYFFKVAEYGAALEYALESIIYKMEFSSRSYDKDLSILSAENLVNKHNELVVQKDHLELALGLEYGHELLNGHSLSLFFEYSTISGVEEEERKKISINQNDVFTALRYSLNDMAGSEIKLGLLYDLDTSGEYIVNLDYDRRINEKNKIKLGYRYFSVDLNSPSVSQILKDNHYLYMLVSRYF